MASDKQTVAFLVEQMGAAGEIRARAMFGEFGVYCDDRFVAMVCDDQLFIKASPAAHAYLDESHLTPPYPGARNAYRVPADRWDDHEWLSNLVRATAAALPTPKPKAPKRAR